MLRKKKKLPECFRLMYGSPAGRDSRGVDSVHDPEKSNTNATRPSSKGAAFIHSAELTTHRAGATGSPRDGKHLRSCFNLTFHLLRGKTNRRHTDGQPPGRNQLRGLKCAGARREPHIYVRGGRRGERYVTERASRQSAFRNQIGRRKWFIGKRTSIP